jgi:hypothetical protein
MSLISITAARRSFFGYVTDAVKGNCSRNVEIGGAALSALSRLARGVESTKESNAPFQSGARSLLC